MARDVGPARVAAFLAAASLSLAVSWSAAAQSDPAVAAQDVLAKCQSAYLACGKACVGASCETCEEIRKKCRAEVYSTVTPGAKKPSGGTYPGGGTGSTPGTGTQTPGTGSGTPTPGGSATAPEQCLPADCKKEVCQGRSIQTPESRPNDCKKEVCQGGSIQTVEDLTERAPTDVLAEEKFCAGNGRSCLGAYRIKHEAEAWARSQIAAQGWPPNSLNNGIADAARHAYWMCRTAQEYKVVFAKGLGDAHEEDSGKGGYGATNSCEEKKMDLHNNSVGRNLWLEPPANHSCAEKVLNSLNLLTTCCGH